MFVIPVLNNFQDGFLNRTSLRPRILGFQSSFHLHTVSRISGFLSAKILRFLRATQIREIPQKPPKVAGFCPFSGPIFGMFANRVYSKSWPGFLTRSGLRNSALGFSSSLPSPALPRSRGYLSRNVSKIVNLWEHLQYRESLRMAQIRIFASVFARLFHGARESRSFQLFRKAS